MRQRREGGMRHRSLVACRLPKLPCNFYDYCAAEGKSLSGVMREALIMYFSQIELPQGDNAEQRGLNSHAPYPDRAVVKGSRY